LRAHRHVQEDPLTESRLKIAVFVDFDNIEIGVKTTLNTPFDIGVVLEAIKERGEVVTKIAYSDWKRAGDYSRQLSQHAIRMVQRNLTPGGDKNGADINLALDALEMAFTHDHINAFVIVGGDSDFITLVEKLKQYDKKVFVVGGRQFTSLVMQKNCHEFIAYENIVGTRRPAGTGRTRPGAPAAAADLDKALPIVKRALKVLSDREVTPQLGLLKSTLLQLDSTFSERDYGASTFRDFIEKVAERGLVTLRQAGRSVLVELADSSLAERISDQPPASEPLLAAAEAPTVRDASTGESVEGAPAESLESSPRPQATEPTSDQTNEAVQTAARIFSSARQTPRWPMYIRQVRQFLRANDETFDERKFGFPGIVEFLRALSRDGLVRLERDRQGVLRVFPGPGMSKTTPARPQPEVIDAVEAAGPVEAGESAAFESFDTPAGTVENESEAEAGSRFNRVTDAEATPVIDVGSVRELPETEEDLSVGPGNVAPPDGELVRKRARKSTARPVRKAAKAPRAPRTRKTPRA
jgi:uncharacterized LabA/DUF88 family protein